MPLEIWEEIVIRLRNDLDVQSFRSACKLWRSLVPSPFPSIFPLKIAPPPPYSEECPTTFGYYITEHTGYLINSNKNSVFVVLEPKPQGHGFFRFRLFAAGHHLVFGQFGSCHRREIDLERFRMSFLYKAYYLQSWKSGYPPNSGAKETGYLKKLILFSYNTNTNRSTDLNPRFAAIEKGVDLAAVAILDNGDLAQLNLSNNRSIMEWKLLIINRQYSTTLFTMTES
ncbi:hypothetical protein RND81_13G137000 [Saponaria officinalis]|uniref:F-box domain-containing protein n=1 Tax=Saponaria officinalis TaxID=3572 RepID=A0AAW1H160_SAPOF